MFCRGEWWQKVGGGAGEQSLAGTWWARDQDVVMSGDGDFKCALSEGLTADMVEEGTRGIGGGRVSRGGVGGRRVSGKGWILR